MQSKFPSTSSTAPNKPRVTEIQKANINSSARPEIPESRLSAHMLGEKPSLTTRVTKTNKPETRERSIEPEETSFV
jgi:hypothetical protein